MIKRSLFAVAALSLASAAQAETVVINANGYTLDDQDRLQRFSGLVIGDAGKVARVLPVGATPPQVKPGVRVIDAGGRTVLPGLIDAHGHVMGLGQAALTLDLSGTKSLAEAQAALLAYVQANPGDGWIRGRGWNQVTWRLGRFPEAGDMPLEARTRKVWLERVDGHAAWVSGPALNHFGLTPSSKDPVGGRVERDRKGAPTGVLVDAAMTEAEAKLPPPSDAERAAALDKALSIMASVGLTGVGDAGVDAPTWSLYQRYAREKKLTTRIYAMAGGAEAMRALSGGTPVGWRDGDMLALKAVKLYADGALGSRGAFLKQPYSDDHEHKGLQFLPQAQLDAIAAEASANGWQVAIHAIGDGANAEALTALERTGKAGPLRHRIEHAQVVDVADLPRFAKAPVIASMQPTHATSDKAMAADRVGEARLQGAYAWRTLKNEGARLAFGSDFPVEPPNPFYGMHAAVTRQDREGQPVGGWRPEQKVSLTEALAGFTTWAAYAEFAEGKVGRLEAGQWADFIVVDRDPVAISAADLWKVQVQETWLGGKQVFKR